MNSTILQTNVQEFIENYSDDTSILAFKGSPFEGITVQELMQQIEGFRKSKKKLPTWHEGKNIYFPPKLSIEQTSSEITARYKASLVQGSSLADLTGGYGVDSYYFSQRFESVTHFELNEELSKIAAHNFRQLGITNINCLHQNGLKGIKDKYFETIYIDPARRHAAKGKVFFLSDCEPNVPENLDFLLEHCDQLLIKTSPMLDISVGLSELKQVKEIHIAAVNNEVKEMLWLIKKEASEHIQIQTANFTKKGLQKFAFIYGSEVISSYSKPLEYLYEPNAAIMKAGAFDHVSEKFELKKLHVNSHLYVHDKVIDFPGRVFKIIQVVPYQKKLFKETQIGKANISIRNFPETVQQLRKKWKIKDGGDLYLFFTTQINDEKIVLVCNKLN